MRLVLDINEATHNELKTFAEAHGTTMKHVVLSGIRLAMLGKGDIPLIKQSLPVADMTASAAHREFAQMYKKLYTTAPDAAKKLDVTTDELIAVIKQSVPVPVHLLEKLRAII